MPPLFVLPPPSLLRLSLRSSTFPLSAPRRLLRTTPTSRGPQVTLYTIGRPSSKDAPYNTVITTLTTRLAPHLTLTAPFLKPSTAAPTLRKAAALGHAVFLCDGAGRTFASSEDFSKALYRAVEDGGSRVVFVIGDADGLSEDVKAVKGAKLISLGGLTLTHRMCRLFLAEQIYRAVEIHKGTGYHK